MVFALYGLAAAMVAGGAWLVVQGYELIVLERGWTMVIGGSVLATGGLLMAHDWHDRSLWFARGWQDQP